MNDWDMVEASVNGYPTGKPKRDIVPTDGMKITVGNRTRHDLSDARPHARNDLQHFPGA